MPADGMIAATGNGSSARPGLGSSIDYQAICYMVTRRRGRGGTAGIGPSRRSRVRDQPGSDLAHSGRRPPGWPGDLDQDGAVPDYRDGQDEPVMTKWELPHVLPLLHILPA